MRIALFGTGGVGGYIGANLCAKGDEITLVARGDHLEAIRERGLKVVEDNREDTARPDAAVDEAGLKGTYDLVILSVKGYDIHRAVDALLPHTDANTIVLPLANGVEHFDTLAARLDAKVLTGCCYILSHIASPGVIRKKGNVFAAVFGSHRHPEAVETVERLFETAGLRSKTPADIETAVWKKYLFISAFATLTSYYDTGIKPVYETYPDETEALLEEIAAVARAKGIEIGEEVGKALQTASGLPDSASTSMHLDFTQGKPTELEALSGYIVKEGETLGVDTPVMRKLYEALKRRSG
ncbi:MAG: 2-dehydropantoate 2-reductase [Campylobacterales bacterium]|jgi:2-dehydropantoate 2-reductase